MRRRERGVPSPARRLGLVLALWAAAAGWGCGREAEPPRLPPVEGDVYRARIFGLSVEKPADWAFLPHTCLARDTDARLANDDLARIWEHLERPGAVPLVAMAPRPDADKREAPVVELHVVPLRPGDKNELIYAFQTAPPEAVLASRSGERARNPGFQVLEPPRPVELGGRAAAVTRLAYRLADDAGRETPVEELMWLLRDGKLFFYLIGTGPAPLPPEVVERFERIAHSIRLDS